MRGWNCRIGLLILTCWAPVTLADSLDGFTLRSTDLLEYSEPAIPTTKEVNATAASAAVSGSTRSANGSATTESDTPANAPAGGDVAAQPRRSSADLLRAGGASAEEDYQAGVMVYARGEMVEAQGILERAANAGHTGAMAILGEILERSGFVAEAAAWYRKSAELGNAEGQFRYASMYLDLQSYNLNDVGVTKNVEEARKWYIRAAEQGHPAALGVVLTAYITGGLGLSGTDRSDAEILKWIYLARDNNNADAMDMLAYAHRVGKYGLAVDSGIADEWTLKAREVRGTKSDEKGIRKISRKRRL
jgi:TPR repeat protein